MRLGDKRPIRFKFWCIAVKITFFIYLKTSVIYHRVDEIHYDYWTHGKTLKELKENIQNDNT